MSESDTITTMAYVHRVLCDYLNYISIKVALKVYDSLCAFCYA